MESDVFSASELWSAIAAYKRACESDEIDREKGRKIASDLKNKIGIIWHYLDGEEVSKKKEIDRVAITGRLHEMFMCFGRNVTKSEGREAHEWLEEEISERINNIIYAIWQNNKEIFIQNFLRVFWISSVSNLDRIHGVGEAVLMWKVTKIKAERAILSTRLWVKKIVKPDRSEPAIPNLDKIWQSLPLQKTADEMAIAYESLLAPFQERIALLNNKLRDEIPETLNQLHLPIFLEMEHLAAKYRSLEDISVQIRALEFSIEKCKGSIEILQWGKPQIQNKKLKSDKAPNRRGLMRREKKEALAKARQQQIIEEFGTAASWEDIQSHISRLEREVVSQTKELQNLHNTVDRLQHELITYVGWTEKRLVEYIFDTLRLREVSKPKGKKVESGISFSTIERAVKRSQRSIAHAISPLLIQLRKCLYEQKNLLSLREDIVELLKNRELQEQIKASPKKLGKDKSVENPKTKLKNMTENPKTKLKDLVLDQRRSRLAKWSGKKKWDQSMESMLEDMLEELYNTFKMKENDISDVVYEKVKMEIRKNAELAYMDKVGVPPQAKQPENLPVPTPRKQFTLQQLERRIDTVQKRIDALRTEKKEKEQALDAKTQEWNRLVEALQSEKNLLEEQRKTLPEHWTTLRKTLWTEREKMKDSEDVDIKRVEKIRQKTEEIVAVETKIQELGSMRATGSPDIRDLNRKIARLDAAISNKTKKLEQNALVRRLQEIDEEMGTLQETLEYLTDYPMIDRGNRNLTSKNFE